MALFEALGRSFTTRSGLKTFDQAPAKALLIVELKAFSLGQGVGRSDLPLSGAGLDPGGSDQPHPAPLGLLVRTQLAKAFLDL